MNDSIRQNIRVGRLDATDAEIEAAAQLAEVDDFIASLPAGYDTNVGERGARLSGGQRQRIAIARAILRDPTILLLDEATSALDPDAEAAINATISRLAASRTVVAVTHRLSLAVHADCIFVFDAGRLAEQGAHQDLLQAGGIYQKLWAQQSGFVMSSDRTHVAVQARRLGAIPLFSGLAESLLTTIAERFVTEHIAAGQDLCHEGDPGDKFYLLVRGSVEVLQTAADGTMRRLTVLQDGDFFGEIALLRRVPRTATVRTRLPCTLLVLDRQAFEAVLAHVPQLRDTFAAVAAQRLQRDERVLLTPSSSMPNPFPAPTCCDTRRQ